MREMLEDLRIELGIPATDADEDPQGLGMLSTWSPKHHTMPMRSNMTSLGASLRAPATALYDGNGRVGSPDAKPPLPRSQARNTKTSASNELSLQRAPEVDVLRIEHSDDVDAGAEKAEENEVCVNNKL